MFGPHSGTADQLRVRRGARERRNSTGVVRPDEQFPFSATNPARIGGEFGADRDVLQVRSEEESRPVAACGLGERRVYPAVPRVDLTPAGRRRTWSGSSRRSGIRHPATDLVEAFQPSSSPVGGVAGLGLLGREEAPASRERKASCFGELMLKSVPAAPPPSARWRRCRGEPLRKLREDPGSIRIPSPDPVEDRKERHVDPPEYVEQGRLASRSSSTFPGRASRSPGPPHVPPGTPLPPRRGTREEARAQLREGGGPSSGSSRYPATCVSKSRGSSPSPPPCPGGRAPSVMEVDGGPAAEMGPRGARRRVRREKVDALSLDGDPNHRFTVPVVRQPGRDDGTGAQRVEERFNGIRAFPRPALRGLPFSLGRRLLSEIEILEKFPEAEAPEKEARHGRRRSREGLNPDQSSRIGISRSIVTRRKARRAASAPFSIFSLRAPFIRSGWASTASREPKSRISSDAVFSPIRERRGRCRTGPPPARGVRPPSPGNAEDLLDLRLPHGVLLQSVRTFTRGETSWYMSLSEETMTTSIPRSSRGATKVPMMVVRLGARDRQASHPERVDHLVDYRDRKRGPRGSSVRFAL